MAEQDWLNGSNPGTQPASTQAYSAPNALRICVISGLNFFLLRCQSGVESQQAGLTAHVWELGDLVGSSEGAKSVANVANVAHLEHY